MDDLTESVRAIATALINAQAGSREALEADNGKVWDTRELVEEFSVIGFLAPYVLVKRNSDGVRGTMFFQHSPRFYWGFAQY